MIRSKDGHPLDGSQERVLLPGMLVGIAFDGFEQGI
jgi:hypothetical protein